MRSRIAAALEAIGVCLISVAGFTVSVGLGLLVAGAGLVLFGLAVERTA